MFGLGRSLTKVRTAFTDAFEMAELLDDPSVESIAQGEIICPDHYGIDIKNASFGYGEEEVILQNFSFTFER
jgi:ABC-type multidrug transport system fused ATPase/permease subunit